MNLSWNNMLENKRFNDISQRDLFRGYLLGMQNLASQSGASVKAFVDSDLPCFSSLSAQAQKDVLTDVGSIHDLWMHSTQDGRSLRDNKQLVWRFLSSLKWTPPSDIFDKITDDRAIEIFNFEGHQMFRSLRILELMSFTLEQAMCTPWWNLFGRDPADVQPLLHKYAQQCFDGTIKSTFKIPPCPHICYEINSAEKLRFHLDIQYVTPLFQNSQPVGFIAISEIEPAGS